MNLKSNSILLLLLMAMVIAVKADHLLVFAASSTTDAINELATAFKAEGGESIRFNFASSGTLARQIEAGAPADVFVSANAKWMDWLEGRELIEQSSRFNLASNTLVMIAPKGSLATFDANVQGRIATGDLKSVPAGLYAAEALRSLGWMQRLRPNLVMASNVRTALLYVERGEVAAGIVYATDAKASAKVSVIGTFPEESHSPIVYPAASCSANSGTGPFLSFLKSNTAKQILTKYGFK
ncbi:Molybdate-binding periplasmic protein [Pontiella sulfatireligans]|uniref:Molybdate-binding periplasmic protein n=1 Tax=Pontiella sulfatireligans TaxID=2750658 RepID=A0A6C2UT51_9BACT|nr:Molybdate-binding periplasmic protein [Pontiella sulfatireligans]